MNKRLFPSNNEVRMTIAITSFLIGISIGITFSLSKLDMEEYISSIATLIAAFSGAGFAFYLAYLAKHKQEEEAQFMQLSKALFVLMRQINAIEGIGQNIDKFDCLEKLAFGMSAIKVNDYKDLKIDFDGLAFLSSTKHVNALFNLTIEQERFEQVLSCCDVRHNFYQNVVTPEIIKVGLAGRLAGLDEYAELLSDRAFKGSMQGAEQMQTEVDAYRESSVKMRKQLLKVAREIYPHKLFHEITLNSPEEGQSV